MSKSEDKLEFTGFLDKNGIPIAVGDLVRLNVLQKKEKPSSKLS